MIAGMHHLFTPPNSISATALNKSVSQSKYWSHNLADICHTWSQQCISPRDTSTYVVTQLSFTTVVGVAEGQQAAGQDSVVIVSMIH